MGRRLDRALALAATALAAGVALGTWWPLLQLELLGWDSYPMIVAGRVTGAGELVGTFGEELMDGRYPLGRFWRPLVHLAFAFDYAVWGLDPFGYHLTDLAILAASAALTACVAARVLRLDGGAAVVAALVAGLAFGLNPVHFEILPVAPRRADSLAVLFTLLALLVVSGGPPRAARALVAGCFCALAVASKETGVIATAAVFLFLFFAPPGEGRAGLVGRATGALRSGVPVLFPVALALVGRTIALGGLGGSEATSLTAGLAGLHVRAVVFLRQLALPPSVLEHPYAGLITMGLALACAVALAVAARCAGRRVGLVAGFLAAWAVVLVLVTSTSGYDQGWYAYPFLPIWSLAVALLAATGWDASRAAGATGARIAGAVLLALAASLTLNPARGTPLVAGAADFSGASEVGREFLTRFERRVGGAAPGSTIRVDRMPSEVYVLGKDDVPRRVIYVLFTYSAEAYADLVFGEGAVRVGAPGFPSNRPTGPDVIDVTVIPAQLGMRP